jgi:putative redox protein
MVSLSLDWAGELTFRNSVGSPAIDLHSSTPGVTSPPQALAYAVMACMAMDIVHILQKSRQELRGMTVTFEGERAADHPRRFVSMHVTFEMVGRVESAIVDRAIALSRSTYCSVWNTLRQDVDLVTSYRIRES